MVRDGPGGPGTETPAGHWALFAAASSRASGLSLVTMPAGSSTIEPNLVPRDDTGFRFTSFTNAADQAGWSRRYGGIHFEDGDLNGRTLGHQVGGAVWVKAVTYFNGTVT